LISITNEVATDGGSDHTMAYLEKHLIESWERAIDRTEERNLEFYAPREYENKVELIHADDKESKPEVKYPIVVDLGKKSLKDMEELPYSD
jgi:hypothetical protein